jgi:MYND finger/RING-type zinc-finger
MSNDGSPLSTNLLELRKTIECDNCEKSGPSNRCSRCHLTYYCSMQCQKSHWQEHKVDCIPVNGMRNRFVGVECMPVSTEDVATNAECCSICLSETIEHPIVLPHCGHVFCFACLMDWQNYTKNTFNYWKEGVTCQKGSCPCCRETIEKSIVVEAIEKALMYAAAGRLTDKYYDHHLKNRKDVAAVKGEKKHVVTMDERQEKFCTLAIEQVDKVLMNDPKHLNALCIKGEILRHVKPKEAIEALVSALRIDKEGVKKQMEMDHAIQFLESRRYMHEISDESLSVNEEEEEMFETYERLLQESESGFQIGHGPSRLYTIKIWISEAHETAHEFKLANALYQEMLREVFQLDYSEYVQIDAPTIRMMMSGASRSLFHLKDLKRALKLANDALAMNRYYPGIHILVAQAQWGLNKKKDAIRTMCRGVLYETPWDETNQKRNRDYLEEFVDAMR